MKNIELTEADYEKIKDQINEVKKEPIKSWEDLIGTKILFRTVTYFQVGRIIGFFGDMVELEDSSWVADTGRFYDAIKTGVLSEVEPIGTCFVNKKSLVDAIPWTHDLPTEQK